MNKSTLMDKTTSYHDRLLSDLSDRDEAMAYLRVALEEYESDEDADSFMVALRNVAEAQGGVGALAKKTQLNRPHIYKILSSKGNPRFITLDNILRAMGFRLSIEAA
jgi:probable addiction module antidote protein